MCGLSRHEIDKHAVRCTLPNLPEVVHIAKPRQRLRLCLHALEAAANRSRFGSRGRLGPPHHHVQFRFRSIVARSTTAPSSLRLVQLSRPRKGGKGGGAVPRSPLERTAMLSKQNGPLQCNDRKPFLCSRCQTVAHKRRKRHKGHSHFRCEWGETLSIREARLAVGKTRVVGYDGSQRGCI